MDQVTADAKKAPAPVIPESLIELVKSHVSTLETKTAKGGQEYKSETYETPDFELAPGIECAQMRVSFYAWKIGPAGTQRLSKTGAKAIASAKSPEDLLALIDAAQKALDAATTPESK